MVERDRPAAGGPYRLVVWRAGLDGAGLQEHQTRRRAGAAYPHAPARAGGPPVAGRGRSDLVAAARRGRGGRAEPGAPRPGRHAPRPPASADAACHTLAAGACLAPGRAPAAGRVARPGPAAPGALRPCTSAWSPFLRGDPICGGAGTATGRVRPLTASVTETCMRVTLWIYLPLSQSLPSKESEGPLSHLH